MDSELKNYLEGMEARMREHAIHVETRLHVHLSEELAAIELRQREHAEAECEKLMNAFGGWTRTADRRYRQASAVAANIEERLAAIEDRVADLERRRP